MSASSMPEGARNLAYTVEASILFNVMVPNSYIARQYGIPPNRPQNGIGSCVGLQIQSGT